MQAKTSPRFKYFYLDEGKPEFGEIDASEVFVYFKNGHSVYYSKNKSLLIVRALNFKVAANYLLTIVMRKKRFKIY